MGAWATCNTWKFHGCGNNLLLTRSFSLLFQKLFHFTGSRHFLMNLFLANVHIYAPLNTRSFVFLVFLSDLIWEHWPKMD